MISIARPPRGGQTTVDFRPLFDPGAYAADIPLRIDFDGAMQFIRDVVAPHGCGYGNVVAIPPDSGKCVGIGFDGRDLDGVGAFVEAHAKDNLYWSVNPTHRPVHGKPKKPDIAAMCWAHLDFDNSSPEALARLRQLRPTLIIFTGGGYGAFWRLNQPIRVNGNLDVLERVNNHLIDICGAGKGTQNLDRLMRLPATINWLSRTKRAKGRKPAATYIVEYHA